MIAGVGRRVPDFGRQHSVVGPRPAARYGRRVALVSLANLLLACPFLVTGARTPSGAAQADSQSLLAQADALLSEMSEITGLPVKAPLKKQIIARPEVHKYLEENLRGEYSPEELHAQQAALRAFGLVSSDFNLEKFLLDFYTEQAAGFTTRNARRCISPTG
jgi:hypothetical protein